MCRVRKYFTMSPSGGNMTETVADSNTHHHPPFIKHLSTSAVGLVPCGTVRGWNVAVVAYGGSLWTEGGS